MLDSTALEKVKDCIKNGQRFVLTTHVNPDGDGLGSEVALAGFLEDRGKDVYIFNCSPVPANYDFLNHDNRIKLYDTEQHRETLLTADYIFVLDISDWTRLMHVGEDIRSINIKKVCIDHHPPYEKFGDIRLVDTDACSTGEIVFQLIKSLDGRFTLPMAEALYTSILTDTGSFKFSNTNKHAFAISAELMQAGLKPQKVYQYIYERQSINKIRLFGHILSSLHLSSNGKIAWFSITRELMKKTGARPVEIEGFADYPRVLNGVEVTIMFSETEPGRLKVSLRSKGHYTINEIANRFGGGGHRFAAGIMLEGDIEANQKRILDAVSDLVR
jgi:phosphoesterase RecJ-like protein